MWPCMRKCAYPPSCGCDMVFIQKFECSYFLNSVCLESQRNCIFHTWRNIYVPEQSIKVFRLHFVRVHRKWTIGVCVGRSAAMPQTLTVWLVNGGLPFMMHIVSKESRKCKQRESESNKWKTAALQCSCNSSAEFMFTTDFQLQPWLRATGTTHRGLGAGFARSVPASSPGHYWQRRECRASQKMMWRDVS